MSSQADLSDFDGFVQLLELDAQTLVVKGQASLIEKQRLIDQILENSFVVQLGQGKFGQCLVSSVSSCLRILELTYYIYIYSFLLYHNTITISLKIDFLFPCPSECQMVCSEPVIL